MDDAVVDDEDDAAVDDEDDAVDELTDVLERGAEDDAPELDGGLVADVEVRGVDRGAGLEALRDDRAVVREAAGDDAVGEWCKGADDDAGDERDGCG